ncbi:hypothetical protein AXG93_4378s1000 [Marchantia polymorpha subsp. ruderalis]|uniref:Uncharacterized protein n=1 Tax=Marchantia polymorpha subsp. ruderalis TaxID=1480154 RepID=A0A176WFX0_MARPO|nr:hypothetical protein AXG93_4378s1000 [Marchantia polymorpha subsp. ruderalis]
MQAGQRSHASRFLQDVRGGNIRASRVRQRWKQVRQHCDTEQERERAQRKREIDRHRFDDEANWRHGAAQEEQQIAEIGSIEGTLRGIGDFCLMGPIKFRFTRWDSNDDLIGSLDWVGRPQGLVALDACRSYIVACHNKFGAESSGPLGGRRELSELHLDFLLWNWNCISASICKEIMDKNQTEGKDLQGNPMLWTIKHWVRVMGSCAGSDGDLLFKKSSMNLTHMEEFSFRPLFNNGRSGTNGWTPADYKDPKRRAIALGIMHILQPARTTYVTTLQVGFFERVIKGQQVHWARIFYDLVWVNVSSRWSGPLANHLTPFLVIFYRGMGLLTREEERDFRESEKS